MSRPHNSTVDNKNERIDAVADMLLTGKTKGEIKKAIKSQHGVGYRTTEEYLTLARQRILEEESHVEFVVGLLNRLWGKARICRKLAEEKGIVSRRSAERIVECSIVQRDRNAKVTAADAKAENLEAYRQIVRDTDDDRTRILALQRIDVLLGLERIKVDMTVNEEDELNAMIADEIASLRNGNLNGGKKRRKRLIEGNGRKNGK